jgi:hypothetical protein
MEITRDFEQFQGGPTKASSAALHVTIHRTGRIFFNAFTHRKMGSPQSVYLYFSREKDIIILEPSNPRLPKSFPVMPHLAGGVRVHAAPFCHHFGIRIDTTEKFIRPDIDEKCRLILRLSDTVTVTRPRKKKRKSER